MRLSAAMVFLSMLLCACTEASQNQEMPAATYMGGKDTIAGICEELESAGASHVDTFREWTTDFADTAGITGYSAKVNPLYLNYHIKAFINLEVEPLQKPVFYPFIEKIPNVVECNCVTGDYSMLIETLFESTAQLDHFINELQQFGRTKTQIVFSTSVEQREVPIETKDE